MAQTKMTTIRLKIAELRPDPIQYKPYSPAFAPEELYLEVGIPSSLVSEERGIRASVIDDKIDTKTVVSNPAHILAPDGYKYLLNYLATLVAEAHDERLKEMSHE